MKIEQITSLSGRAYFRFWSTALKALLGWSDDRIEQWAEKFQTLNINNEGGMLFHELPETFVIGEYMAERYPGWQEKLRQKNQLTENVIRGLSDCINHLMYPELWEGKGWDAGRERIDAEARRLGL
jgi:hypothetical protein